MRTPEPLRNSPSYQFRKRKSLYSRLFSEGRSDPITSIDSIPRYHGTHGQVGPKDYMSDLPEQYTPHPGFMQISQPDYQDNDNFMMENIPHPDHQSIIDEFRFTALELAGRRVNEEKVDYEDSDLNFSSSTPKIFAAYRAKFCLNLHEITFITPEASLWLKMELRRGIEPLTSALPWPRSTN